jgi:hypothetical protein
MYFFTDLYIFQRVSKFIPSLNICYPPPLLPFRAGRASWGTWAAFLAAQARFLLYTHKIWHAPFTICLGYRSESSLSSTDTTHQRGRSISTSSSNVQKRWATPTTRPKTNNTERYYLYIFRTVISFYSFSTCNSRVIASDDKTSES